MVILLDKRKHPYGWCKPDHARRLIQKGEACVYRYHPFTLILKHRDARKVDFKHSYRIKIDPGAKYTGIAVTEGDTVILLMQIEHRAQAVVSNLQTRSMIRRNRRSRKTRYRRCKFAKKGSYKTTRSDGWLPPSQRSIVGNIKTIIKRLIKLLGPCHVSDEFVKFDTQLLADPEISGKGYQQGTLLGYEMKSYLLERYAHTCQYCGGKTEDKRLEWEHMQPKSRGGSDSVKNATLACCTCNREKGNLTPEEWLAKIKAGKHKTTLDQVRISCIEKVTWHKPVGLGLRYAAWSNITRKSIADGLFHMDGVLSLELASGGRTAYNRSVLKIEKDHHLDALCVGKFIPKGGFKELAQPVLYIKATGRGNRRLGQINKCGIITNKWYGKKKRHFGFQTGDIVTADVKKGKHVGIYTGRVNVRESGWFDIKTFSGDKIAVKADYCKLKQRMDGYQYGCTKSKAV